jgi:UDP-N-acetylglucosamine 2-epimerase
MVKRLIVFFGARPDSIKIVPAVRSLSNKSDVKVCVMAGLKEI